MDKNITITIKIENCESENLKVESEKKIDLSGPSMYARIFDQTSPYWERDAEYNKMFLMKTQTYCNDLLKAKKCLLLNDVYDQLGFGRTKAGAVVGWVYDEKNPIGDNYIDFGIFDKRNSDFINGSEYSAILDFNVDGIILDRLQD